MHEALLSSSASKKGNSGVEGIQVRSGRGGRLSLLLSPTAWPLGLQCLTSFCNRESRGDPQKVVVILCQLCTFRIEAVVIHVIHCQPLDTQRASQQARR